MNWIIITICYGSSFVQGCPIVEDCTPHIVDAGIKVNRSRDMDGPIYDIPQLQIEMASVRSDSIRLRYMVLYCAFCSLIGNRLGKNNGLGFSFLPSSEIRQCQVMKKSH